MKKVLSILLALVMLTSSMSNILVFAADISTVSKITAESTYSFPGGTVDVEVTLSNNPSIYNLLMSFDYDSTALKLIAVSNGTAMSDVASFTPPKNMASGCSASWYYIDEPDTYKDGSLVVLTFEVLETAEAGESYSVSVTNVTAEDVDGTECDIYVVNGKISIIDYIPGDVNGDGKHTIRKDVSEFNQYIVDGCKYDPLGYAVQINENAGDVNDDNKINIRDVIQINKYIVDGCTYDPNGYAVKLLPHTPRCQHTSLTAVPAKESTCTEVGSIPYWQCEECEKIFRNETATLEIVLADTIVEAKGHTEVTIPSIKPTDTTVGYTEGKKCSVCGAITVEPTVIPIPNSYAINYDIFNGDSYLSKLNIDNPNPKSYKDEDTLNSAIDLVDLNAPDGYRFLGWYDGAGDGAGNGANKVRTIPQGATENKKFYAHWNKIEYTVQFDSPDNPVESVKYTVDKGVQIKNPAKVNQYDFVGWSNDDGFFVNSIEPGTIGDITLHANWTSYRNRTTAYASYGDPIVIENAKDKQFLFVYKIGEISNVPVSTIYDYGWRTKGSSITKTVTKSNEITQESANEISDTIAKATTTSSGWTLSKDWNEYYSAETEATSGQVMSEERTNSKGEVVGGEYFISNSDSGSTFVSNECGGSVSTSAKVTTEQSSGINGSLDLGSKTYGSVKVGVENKTEVSAGVKVPIPIGVAEAGVKNTTTVGASAEVGREDTAAIHFDAHKENYIGTYNSTDTNSYFNSTVNNSSAWNTTSGYTQSKEQSIDTSVSNAIVKEIESRDKINISNALTEGSSVQGSDSYSATDSETYTSTLRSSKGTKNTETYEDKQTFAADGYYRLVQSARVYVYGVVGYDVASSSFYTYTYSVMDDELKPWLDYSMNNQYFNDCENGVLPFKVPIYPLEYVSFLTNKSTGLEFDLADKLTGYDDTANDIDDGVVVVPQYYGAYNGKDGTYTAVTVKSFDGNENVFKGNKTIKTVVLPKSITAIPDNAFEGCTNLETVIAYGITTIGDNAFNGCTSLNTFTVDKFVEHLGDNAFGGVNEIVVEAANINVFDAALSSGAKKITISMHSLTEPLENKTITIPADQEYFALLDNGKEHSGLVINSSADETYISNMSFIDNNTIPLVIDSEKLTLNRVSVVDTPKLALQLKKDNTTIYLYGTVSLSSETENAVLCRNITVKKENAEMNGELDVEGKVIVCGEDEFEGKNRITATKGIVFVDKSRYDSILKSHIVTFNTLGGSSVEYQLIEDGTNLIEPADPTKTSNTFLGWYTDEDCTAEFNFDTPITSDTTLYAKWKLNEFNVSFNANGGNVSQTAKEVIYGEAYGTLPTPSRTGYSFNGWYTAVTGGTKIAADTTVSAASDHTLYAQWALNTYKVSWSNVTGVTISVKRTESPYANAQIGSLSSGNTVNYGDVLSVTYSTQTGYTKTSNGKTTITVTGNITSEHIYANATLNSYKATWTVPTGGTITVKRTSSPLAGATTGTLSSGNTVYHGDVLAITYSANTGYSVATKGKTSVTVAGNITNSDIYLTVTPNDYTYNIVYKSSNGTALGTDTVTKAFATTNTVTPKTFAGYDTPASQSVKWDATSKTITFTYTPTAVAPKTISKSKVIRYIGTYVSVEAVVEHQNRTKDSVQIRINWTVIHNGPNNPTFSHGITAKATIGSASNTTKITSYISAGHVKDQRYSKASDWITVPLDSTQASSINIAVSTWQTNSNGTNISSGGGSNYTNYTDTWSIAVPAY